MIDLLTELGTKYGTDKATHHKFTPFYNLYFERKRFEIKNIMEIGVLNGASLKMWSEYFPNANIIGVDIQDKSQYEDNRRIKIYYADQSIPDDLINVANQYDQFDIIIDDGSHLIPHQYITLATLYPYLKENGYYVLEDLHCSYFPKWEEWRDDNVKVTMLDSIKSLKQWLDEDNINFQYQYINENDASYIKDYTDWVEIFDRTGDYDSITSIIRKT